MPRTMCVLFVLLLVALSVAVIPRGVSIKEYVTRLCGVGLQSELGPPDFEHNVDLCHEFPEVKTAAAGLLVSPEFLGAMGEELEAWATALYKAALNRDLVSKIYAHRG